jgi:translation initiation factor 3 subunit B
MACQISRLKDDPTIHGNPHHIPAKMAPSYENLPIDDDGFDEEEIDFSDLQEQYEVRLEEGLDAFVVVDGLPIVPEDNKQKLIKFLLRKLNTVGKVKEDGVFMPLNEKNMTEG